MLPSLIDDHVTPSTPFKFEAKSIVKSSRTSTSPVCKAAILVEQNKPLIVDTIELPERLFSGQVLVDVK